jgi:hypothetical protein
MELLFVLVCLEWKVHQNIHRAQIVVNMNLESVNVALIHADNTTCVTQQSFDKIHVANPQKDTLSCISTSYKSIKQLNLIKFVDN